MPLVASTRRWAGCVCVLGLALPLHAQERDDMRRVLEQGAQLRSHAREQQLLAEDGQGARPVVTIDGQTYTVQRTANDVGQALYLALQHQQWAAAQRFLAEYLTLEDRDPLLVYYAQGALARVAGRYAAAADAYRALLAAQPGFLPARLELARVLFEDQQDREAATRFAAIETDLDGDDPRTDGVRRSVQRYRQALRDRATWTGAVAAGPTWSDNINRTSASRTCLLADGSGTCFIERQLPAAIAANGLDYDASLERRWALRGHHGAYARGLVYGQAFDDHAAYNEFNLAVQAGYSWRSGRHSAALAPSFDYQALGNSALFGAAGLHGEWSWTVSPRQLLKLEADWKVPRYRRTAYAEQYDGRSAAVYATWYQGLGARWTVFGGVDLLDSDAREASNGYRQYGVRLGAVRQWNGVSATVFTALRHRDYDAYSPLLAATRRDDEQGWIGVLKAERFAVAGLVPSLTLRYNQVDSSVGWLYGYDRTLVSLKLERAF
ncbi:surface lipoprotein assembly modifier [Stenotrophomonas sp. LGBM10]|uniref:surface lipoprotein assembly modifier n=1 Tax=Stenotrophomonas sp. LGBM10 TaxID=3390038 RepID=UPI00398BA9C7